MPRDKAYFEYLSECSVKAANRMDELLSTPEGIAEEMQRQSEVGLMIQNYKPRYLARARIA